MSDFLFKFASKTNIIIAFALLIACSLVWFPIYGMYYHTGDANPLDFRLSYNLVDIIKHFNALEQEGRADYQFALQVIDMLFPIIYGSLLILLIAYIVKHRFDGNPLLLFILILFPLIVVVMDYFENFNTLHMLSVYPNIPESLASAGAIFTLFKWLFTIITLLTIITGYILALIGKRELKQPSF